MEIGWRRDEFAARYILWSRITRLTVLVEPAT